MVLTHPVISVQAGLLLGSSHLLPSSPVVAFFPLGERRVPQLQVGPLLVVPLGGCPNTRPGQENAATFLLGLDLIARLSSYIGLLAGSTGGIICLCWGEGVEFWVRLGSSR